MVEGCWRFDRWVKPHSRTLTAKRGCDRLGKGLEQILFEKSSWHLQTNRNMTTTGHHNSYFSIVTHRDNKPFSLLMLKWCADNVFFEDLQFNSLPMLTSLHYLCCQYLSFTVVLLDQSFNNPVCEAHLYLWRNLQFGFVKYNCWIFDSSTIKWIVICMQV